MPGRCRRIGKRGGGHKKWVGYELRRFSIGSSAWTLGSLPCSASAISRPGAEYFRGFPSYSKGPFERIGVETTVPLLSPFLLVCLLEGVAGWLLWSDARAGAILSLILFPFGATFWWGFALPFPPIFAAARTVLIVLNWQQPPLSGL